MSMRHDSQHAPETETDVPDTSGEHARAHGGSAQQLTQHVGNTGHGEHHDDGHAGHGDHVEQFRRLFWIMLALAVPVVGFSDMFADLVGYQLPEVAWVAWVPPVLGTVIYFWGGSPFLTLSLIHI